MSFFSNGKIIIINRMFTTRGRTQRAGLHGAAAQKHANLGVGRSGSRALLDVGASVACDTASSRPGPRFHPRLRTQALEAPVASMVLSQGHDLPHPLWTGPSSIDPGKSRGLRRPVG